MKKSILCLGLCILCCTECRLFSEKGFYFQGNYPNYPKLPEDLKKEATKAYEGLFAFVLFPTKKAIKIKKLEALAEYLLAAAIDWARIFGVDWGKEVQAQLIQQTKINEFEKFKGKLLRKLNEGKADSEVQGALFKAIYPFSTIVDNDRKDLECRRTDLTLYELEMYLRKELDVLNREYTKVIGRIKKLGGKTYLPPKVTLYALREYTWET